jgi:hypothetical protein
MPIKDEQYNKYAAEVGEIIKFNQEKRAARGVKIIKNFLAGQHYEAANPELYAAYNKLIAKLKWVALLFYNEDEIADLFRNNLAEMLEIEGYDLEEKFKVVLLAKLIVYEERDKYKEKIRSILNKSQVLLTSKKLTNNEVPTAENWIKAYVAEMGLSPAESLKFQNFFLTNASVIVLPRAEAEKLKFFFSFYERLKLSSLTVAGVEEEIAFPLDEVNIGYIRDGKIEKEGTLSPEDQRIFDAIVGVETVKAAEQVRVSSSKISQVRKSSPSDEKLIAELKETVVKYPFGSLERKAVEAEIKKLGGGSQ